MSCVVVGLALEGVQASLDTYQLNMDAWLNQKPPTWGTTLAAECWSYDNKLDISGSLR